MLPKSYGGNYFQNMHTFYYFKIARLFYTSGQLNNAEEWFLRILNLNTGQYYFGDLYSRSFYFLGKIYQKKGWVGKAIESYEKFYSLWKDGDPEFVGELLYDARVQLENLNQ